MAADKPAVCRLIGLKSKRQTGDIGARSMAYAEACSKIKALAGGSQMTLDVFVVCDANRTALGEDFGPAQRRSLVTALENKELAFLFERMAGLHQGA